jgi:DMSO/TMAO reductase YedYZ molybdopterin-dependent catalytic subunit
MSQPTTLRISGAVANACELTFHDLAAIDAAEQIVDVQRLVSSRQGDAVTLRGLMSLVRPQADVKYLTLHASRDDFHASIPLDKIAEKAFLIYRLDGQPLSVAAGGPFRFFIPDHLACRSADIDECANVKYVDEMEFTVEKGHDNRPHDDAAHAELHAREQHGK